MAELIRRDLKRTNMAKSHKILRIVTAVVWAASIATVALSLYVAHATGYHYAPLQSFRTYNGILTGSAFVLAIVLLAGVLTIQRVDTTMERLFESMGEGLFVGSGRPADVSELQTAVNERVQQTSNTAQAQRLQQSLEEYTSLQSFRRNLKSLIAAPVGLLSAIFAVSAWALPAETFLQNLALLNTTLLFFVTYGMVVAIASAAAAALLMLSSGRTTVRA